MHVPAIELDARGSFTGEREDGLAVGIRVEPEGRPGQVDRQEAVECECGSDRTEGRELDFAVFAVEEHVQGKEDEAVVIRFEREVSDVAFDEGGIDCLFLGAGAGELEHRGRGVDAGDGVPVEGEFEGNAAGATANLQHRPVGTPGEGQPEADVVVQAGMDSVVEVRVDGVGVRHVAIVDCRLPGVDPGSGEAMPRTVTCVVVGTLKDSRR